ncbi:MAG: methylenetetrahydrofolate reductase C-terminal domain-containing protein [Candidatus Baldrarchaeia archaeon]|mgnify:CR=1 FL=1
MIITKMKPLDEIEKMIEPYEKIFLLGCNSCAAVCRTGGEEQIKEFYKKFSGKKKITGSIVAETPCDMRTLRADLRLVRKAVEESDAILVFACGVGVQTVAALTGKIVIPALNTLFSGQVERIGVYHELCKFCGDCMLYETVGICPIAICPVMSVNGPCEYVVDGKCTLLPGRECVWYLILDRAKSLGLLDLALRYRESRRYHGALSLKVKEE